MAQGEGDRAVQEVDEAGRKVCEAAPWVSRAESRPRPDKTVLTVRHCTGTREVSGARQKVCRAFWAVLTGSGMVDRAGREVCEAVAVDASRRLSLTRRAAFENDMSDGRLRHCPVAAALNARGRVCRSPSAETWPLQPGAPSGTVAQRQASQASGWSTLHAPTSCSKR